jgi:hypothetical protein
MSKQALSVTLQDENVTWLKARAGAAGLRSVSELLDRIVSAARSSGQAGVSTSVVGTIDIDSSDPGLDTADEAIRGVYARSLRRPMMANEPRAPHGRKRRGGRRG